MSEVKVQASGNTVSAKNQVHVDSHTSFFGDPSSSLRILVVGNSITRHGPKPDIGWFWDWGMAATCEENDFVHQLVSKLQKANISFYMMVRHASEWEIGMSEGKQDLSGFAKCQEFGADIIVYRLSENVAYEVPQETYYAAMKEFINYLNKKGGKVIFTTSFWKKKEDEMTRKLAKEMGEPLIELGDLGEDASMMAFGKFEHPGVAQHPNDKGMETIAERVFETIESLCRK